MGDEPELVPTYRVYLSGCNFRCRFCDTAPGCFEPERGEQVIPLALANECQIKVHGGARTIHILGGEPSLHAHTILELAAEAEAPLPLTLDSNMYMTPQVIEWLEGVVTMYVADFKFGNDECAHRLAGVSRYLEVVCRNLLLAARSTPMIIRHLLMPGHFECCLRPVADWVAANLPEVRFQLHTGYLPCWRAESDNKIGRLNSGNEIANAWEYVRLLHLKCQPATSEVESNA